MQVHLFTFFGWSRVVKRFGQDLIMVIMFLCLILLFGSSFGLADIVYFGNVFLPTKYLIKPNIGASVVDTKRCCMTG